MAICLVIFSFSSSASVPSNSFFFPRGADKIKKKMKILFKKIKFTQRRLDDDLNLIHNRLLLAWHGTEKFLLYFVELNKFNRIEFNFYFYEALFLFY